jgi:hypothetical protein
MVLTLQNSGKYLTKEWNDPDGLRQQCIHDWRNFSTEDRTYYEVYGTGIYDGLGYQLDNAMCIETSPVDIRTEPKKMDQRDKPEVGW